MKKVQTFSVFVRKVLALTFTAGMGAVAVSGCAQAPVESEEDGQTSTEAAGVEAAGVEATAVDQLIGSCCQIGYHLCPTDNRHFAYFPPKCGGAIWTTARSNCEVYCSATCIDVTIDDC
jgi:hypothetical protein